MSVISSRRLTTPNTLTRPSKVFSTRITKNLELIVVDDGSSDNSHEVLRQFESDSRVTLFLNKENRGQSAAFNQALRVAKGDFIGYLPSDDWHLPQKTRLQIDKFLSVSEKVGVVYGRGARFFEASGETHTMAFDLHRGNVVSHLLKGNFVYPATPMFRRECFEKVKLDESYKAEGEAIYLKIALQFEFDYVDEVVSVMRDHEYNTGKDVSHDVCRQTSGTGPIFFAREDLPKEVADLRGLRLGNIHRTKGLEFIRKLGDHSEGRKALLSAIRTNPRYLLDWKVIAGLGLSLLPAKNKRQE